MNSFKIGLWVSALALSLLAASCGAGNVGIPAEDEQNAQPLEQQLVPDGQPDIAEVGDKGVSYTPGLPVVVPAGVSFMNVEGYGWKYGLVTDGATAPYVKLTTNAGIVPQPQAWIRYDIQENVAGRLHTVRIYGVGTGMEVFMYNYNLAAWVSFGTYDLNNGSPNLAVPSACCSGGHTLLKLRQTNIGWTRVNQIKVDVF